MQIVLTSGVFDLLHPGHLHHLEESRRLGDWLIVAVTADEHVNKGANRPVFHIDQRMAMLRALRCVDTVMCSDWPTPAEVIKYVRPHIYTKHEEYRDRLPEQALVESLGGQVVFTGRKMFNSSQIIRTLECDYL
jgi:rfaE bifunctional protein nucleotidyltransferase chain/domain